MLTARRDNYVARTFSHMARARLDHAVSRSADLEFLGSEKWEMRCAHDLCLSMNMPLPDPMHVEVWQMADCACLHSLALPSSQSGPSALRQAWIGPEPVHSCGVHSYHHDCHGLWV